MFIQECFFFHLILSATAIKEIKIEITEIKDPIEAT
jgi:hypothetical protein